MLKSVSEVCEWTGLGRTRLYEEMNSGRLRSVKIGRRRLIPEQALADWLDTLSARSTF